MASNDDIKYKATTWTQTQEQGDSTTNQQSQTDKTLNLDLLNTILSGLTGQMTDEQIDSFAENLLRPQLNAGLEAADQTYETTRLAKQQEQENLAVSLAKAISEQQAAYRQNSAALENAALARGMGRSSYTIQSMANQGNALAQTIRELTDESGRQSAQIQAQITQAAQQQAQTKNRLNTDYAANLAAKVQELRQNQRDSYNQNYLAAISHSLGSKTQNDSTTQNNSTAYNLTGVVENPGDYASGTKTNRKKSPTTVLPPVTTVPTT